MLNKSSLMVCLCCLFMLIGLLSSGLDAAPNNEVQLNLEAFAQPINFSSSVSLLIALSSISLIPFFLISTTCFLRIVVVLSFIRNAIGTQSSPPNPIILSLAFFMSLFVMSPVLNEVQKVAITPYREQKITQAQAIERGIQPFRNFMIRFTREQDLALFMEFGDIRGVANIDEVPIQVIIPAFIISELKTAFQMGFLLFVPMIVVDLITSNILLSLGMFMLSPVMVSLPFKILLFVLTDGWNLVAKSLLLSFR